MQISIIGTGYVGLVVGVCLADFGHQVLCADRDPSKIDILKAGRVPIYEPGLAEVMRRNTKRLSFTTDTAEAVAGTDIVYIAVGTPPSQDYSADLTGVLAVADDIGKHMARPMLVVIKSTVPVGTAEKVREVVGRNAAFEFDVVSNPEFLAEGNAVQDFRSPDRIVLGYSNPWTGKTMERLYSPLVRNGVTVLHMDNRSAELAKYASNSMLAARISFMNELARLCEEVGADIEPIRLALGTDRRIGPHFLHAGAGYGGSCFPKDVRALMRIAEDVDCRLQILESVHAVNEAQKHVLASKVVVALGGELVGRRVAVWGLSFKPGTDDVREAPALVIIEDLLAAGAEVVAYDPEATDTARAVLGDRITYAASTMDALDDADALVIPTEWHAFRSPDLQEVGERMRGRLVVDGRNIYDPDQMAEAGFDYRCIGRPG